MTELGGYSKPANPRSSSKAALRAAEILHNAIRYSIRDEADWTRARESVLPEYQEIFGQIKGIIIRRYQLADPGDNAIGGSGKVAQIVNNSSLNHLILNAILINRLYSTVEELPEIDDTQKARIVAEAKAMREEAGVAIDGELKAIHVSALILEGKFRISPN